MTEIWHRQERRDTVQSIHVPCRMQESENQQEKWKVLHCIAADHKLVLSKQKKMVRAVTR